MCAKVECMVCVCVKAGCVGMWEVYEGGSEVYERGK